MRKTEEYGTGGAGKGRLSRAGKIRRAKQVIMGALFLALLAGGWFFPFVGYFIPLCMIAGTGIALFRGRKWCNWFCPRGSFADSWMAKVSPGSRVPDIFKGTGLRVGVMAFLMIMLTYRIGGLWPDLEAVGRFFVTLLTITTMAGVVLSMVFHQRTWCYICPIGSLSRWAGNDRHPLSLKADRCVACKVCGNPCPMQLAPYELKAGAMPGRADCLKCGLCIAVCPKDALRFS